MAVFLAIALAAFLFENDHFITLYVAHHDGFDERATHIGYADGEIAVILDEMHGVEGDSVAFLSCQPVDEDLLTFLNFKLLTGDGNDCEHIDSQKIGEKNTLFRKGRAKVLRGFGKTKPQPAFKPKNKNRSDPKFFQPTILIVGSRQGGRFLTVSTVLEPSAKPENG